MTDRSTMDGSEHAWLLGREAGLGEGAADANPYEAGSELAADWADGWREGTNLSNRLVDRAQAWAAWTAGPGAGEAGHDGAP